MLTVTRWGETDGDHGIRAMCDFGAEQVRAGRFDELSFSIMGNESDAVRNYMRENHPSVPYSLHWPQGLKAEAA